MKAAAEIAYLEGKLALRRQHLARLDWRGLQHSPAIQDNLPALIGGAFAGGLVLGLLSEVVDNPLAKLALPLLLRA